MISGGGVPLCKNTILSTRCGACSGEGVEEAVEEQFGSIRALHERPPSPDSTFRESMRALFALKRILSSKRFFPVCQKPDVPLGCHALEEPGVKHCPTVMASFFYRMKSTSTPIRTSQPDYMYDPALFTIKDDSGKMTLEVGIMDYVQRLNSHWKRNRGVSRYYLPFCEVNPIKVVDISMDLVLKDSSKKGTVDNRELTIVNPEGFSRPAIENIFTLLSLQATKAEVIRMFSQESLLFVVDAKKYLFQNARVCTMWKIPLRKFIMLCCHSNKLLTSWELDEILDHLSEVGTVDLERVVKLCPNICDMTFDEFITKMKFFKKVGSKNLGRTIDLCPNLLNHAMHTLESRYMKLQQFNSVEEVHEMFDVLPFILHVRGYNGIETFKRCADYFGRDPTLLLFRKHPFLLSVKWSMVFESYCGLRDLFGRDNSFRMVNRAPGIIQISWSNLKCKIDFLLNEANLTKEDIAIAPSILNRSLNKVLIPRFQKLKKFRNFKKYLSLSSLFNASDSIFKRKLDSIKSDMRNPHLR